MPPGLLVVTVRKNVCMQVILVLVTIDLALQAGGVRNPSVAKASGEGREVAAGVVQWCSVGRGQAARGAAHAWVCTSRRAGACAH